MEFGDRPENFDGESAGDGGELASSAALEAALDIYAEGVLPIGKVCELAGLTRRQFHEELKARGICRPFDMEEVDRELEARGFSAGQTGG